jgi:hypothetical protein
MKRIAIVTGHFPPCNLAGVHRARLWAQHLPEFGWEPIVITTHWKYYEESSLDQSLLELVASELRVVHTKALPVKPVRLVGDIGLRALYWCFKALDELVLQKEIDFIHITVPSNYLATLGEIIHRRYSFPFGIDYQDPWVHPWPGIEKPLSKAWLSYKLGSWLEPWALRNAALITGVAPLHYEPVLRRNPHLRNQCVTAAMPIGNSEADYRLVQGREPFLFSRSDGLFNVIYAGTMWPKAYVVLERFLEALALLRDSDPKVLERLRIYFVGTGKSPKEADSFIHRCVQRLDLGPWVVEITHRIGYLDVLNHLVHASAILILGSTEAHYTPSKVYQSIQAKRPIFALLHEQSTAVGVLNDSHAGRIVTFNEQTLPERRVLATSLADFVRDAKYSAKNVRWEDFELYSARNSARVLAGAINTALEAFEKRKRVSSFG